jgi:hypothetical protein
LYARGEGVLGCYVSGSAARGETSLETDIDFFVVTDGYRGYLERIHGARRVEIRWQSITEMESAIQKGEPIIYQLLDAQVIQDLSGKIQQLKDLAREQYTNYRVSISVLRDVHHRVGEARLKLLAARKSGDIPFMSYLCSIYTELLFEAMFIVAGKPPAFGSTAWHWIRRTEGIAEQGVRQIEEVLQMDVAGLAQAYDAFLNHLHEVLTARIKG